MRRSELWTVIACLSLIVLPLAQTALRGAGLNLLSLIGAVALGVILIGIYLRAVDKARRQVDR
jgi:hypothetical protein